MPDPDKWTVYGTRQHPMQHGRTARAGVHAEFYPASGGYDGAYAWLWRVILTNMDVSAVIVKLDNGIDANGSRHVVYRWRDGKAWWE